MLNKALLEVGGYSNISRVISALEPSAQASRSSRTTTTCVLILMVESSWTREPHAAGYCQRSQRAFEATTRLVVVVACDMPFLSSRLLQELVRRASAVDVVIPLVDGRPEPMHAVYRRIRVWLRFRRR